MPPTRLKRKKKLRRKKVSKPVIAVDTETTGLFYHKDDKPFAVSMTMDDGSNKYWEWPVDPHTRQPIIPKKDKIAIRKVLCSNKYDIAYFNAKFDICMLANIGIFPTGKVIEVSYMARACNNLEYSYALKPLSKKYCDIPTEDEVELKELVKKCRRIAKKLGWNIAKDVPADYWLPNTLHHHGLLPEDLIPKLDYCKTYACTDTDRTFLLYHMYKKQMRKFNVEHIYEMEMQVWKIAFDMEMRGVRIDKKRLHKVKKLSQKIRDEKYTYLQRLSKNDSFNANSPQQVTKLFFEGEPFSLEVLARNKPSKKYPEGSPKTDAETLLAFANSETDEGQAIETLFEYRCNEKALNTFFNKYIFLAKYDDHGDMFLHPGLKSWGALTGRFTCENPNLQQVSDPKTTNSRTAKYVVNIRQIFVPRRGYVFYCPDYSQVEVIVFADISGEPTLLQAIRDGVDIHEATVNNIWGYDKKEKAISAIFDLSNDLIQGIKNGDSLPDPLKPHIEGASTKAKLSYVNDLCGNGKKVQALLDKYEWNTALIEEKVLGLKKYRKRAKACTFTKIFGGGAKALMGWIGCTKREGVYILQDYDNAFPEMQSRINQMTAEGRKNGFVVNPYGRRLTVDRFYAYRTVNYMVQSAAADLMKRGMVNVQKILDNSGADARLLLTVHDELMIEILQGHDDPKLIKSICDAMSDHGGVFSVETPVDVDKAPVRWSEKEKVEIYG